MKAIQVSSFGGPEVLSYQDLPEPKAQAGEILVRVQVAGVNFIDTYQRSGSYPMQLPYIPGLEGAGEVVEVGEEVSGISVGDRVAWPSCPSSYAELVALPANRVVIVPDGIDLETATAAMLQAMTAHYLVRDTFKVVPGSTCLVHAAAGGVGLLMTQMIRDLGGVVIATASTEEKRATALGAGANHVISYEDFGQSVRDLTEGKGVEVVYDGVGKTTFDQSLESLARRGLMVLFGAASGAVEPFDLQRLNRLGSLFITRPNLADYIASEQELRNRAEEIFDWMSKGVLSLKIGARFPLSEAAKAHTALQSRITSGKVLLIPGG
jgi:NADPH:quinone reductase